MQRGEEGAPLPDQARVMRMWHANRLPPSSPAIGEKPLGALPALLSEVFELSTSDRQYCPPYLSVYESSLTSPEQGRLLTVGKSAALFLGVRAVRDLVCPEQPDRRLDVCWFLALVEEGGASVADTRPGAEGHCGITGLVRPSGMPKAPWKWFRARLAELAMAGGIVSSE